MLNKLFRGENVPINTHSELVCVVTGSSVNKNNLTWVLDLGCYHS